MQSCLLKVFRESADFLRGGLLLTSDRILPAPFFLADCLKKYPFDRKEEGMI